MTSLPFKEVPDVDDYHMIATAAMFVSGAAAYIALLFGPKAPYGRYSKGGGIWGPLIPAKVAWFLQELPAFVVPALMLFLPEGGLDSFVANPLSARTLLSAALLTHYTYRTFIFPLKIRGGKPTPYTVFFLSLAFCLWNGFLQGWMLSTGLEEDAPVTAATVVGLAIWLFGFLNVLVADHILVNLRKPGETGYKIPHGGMFNFTSAGNYTSEIIEWSGWALAASQPCAIAFAFFTFCNLAPRGITHHLWYLAKFKTTYPKSRKAVIPFIW